MSNIDSAVDKYVKAKKALLELQGRPFNEDETRNDFLAGYNTNKNLFSENATITVKTEDFGDYRTISMNDIIRNIRDAIERSGKTYTWVAEQLGISKVGIYIMLKEDTEEAKGIPVPRIFQFANILNLPLSAIFRKNKDAIEATPIIAKIPKKDKVKPVKVEPIAPARKRGRPKAEIPVAIKKQKESNKTATKRKQKK